jgi:hypothetical protein
LNGSLSTFDANLGGIAAISVSNANVTLTTNQDSMLILRVTGTLTGNVQITSACQGQKIIENLTTGAFAVTITNGVGTPFTLPQGIAALVIFDSTNGSRRGNSEFASGTSTVFYQTNAPVGWTQNTSYSDYAMRIVNGGTPAAHAGSRGASIAFATQLSVDGHALSVLEMPSHAHTDSGHTHPIGPNYGTAGGATFLAPLQNSLSGATGLGYASIQPTGGGQVHAHTFTLGVNYIDFILASKN